MSQPTYDNKGASAAPASATEGARKVFAGPSGLPLAMMEAETGDDAADLPRTVLGPAQVA